MTGLQELEIEPAGQKRLQNYFDDRNIRYGLNRRTHQKECWYVPCNSRPYRICTCVNVPHALKQLQARSYADRMSARQLLAQIDAHNERIVERMHEDAVGAVRSDLRAVAAGRKHFLAR